MFSEIILSRNFFQNYRTVNCSMQWTAKLNCYEGDCICFYCKQNIIIITYRIYNYRINTCILDYMFKQKRADVKGYQTWCDVDRLNR